MKNQKSPLNNDELWICGCIWKANISENRAVYHFNKNMMVDGQRTLGYHSYFNLLSPHMGGSTDGKSFFENG